MQKREIWIYGVILTLVTMSIIFVTIVFIDSMKGETTTLYTNIEPIENTVLKCSSTSTAYPYFRYDNSNKKELTVRMVFSDSQLKTVFLNYNLYYDNENLIAASEAHNHASMNINYSGDDLPPDSYSASYAKLNDRMSFSLFLEKDKLNATSAKYFLIDLAANEDSLKNIEEFKTNFIKRGFDCEVDK